MQTQMMKLVPCHFMLIVTAACPLQVANLISAVPTNYLGKPPQKTSAKRTAQDKGLDCVACEAIAAMIENCSLRDPKST